MSNKPTNLSSGEAILEQPKKWHTLAIYKLYLYCACCLVFALQVPNSIWDPEYRTFTLTLGILGVWRYLWWLTHVIRSEIYQHKRFPQIRERAQSAWDSGWRPAHLHFMMTTFLERRDTTEKVLLLPVIANKVLPDAEDWSKFNLKKL